MALSALAAAAPPRAAPTAPGEARFRFAVVDGLDGLDALQGEWEGLAGRSGRPEQGFQAFAWLRAWAAHYAGDGGGLRIVAGHFGGRLALVWPLALRRRAGVAILGFMGEPLCQYHDALVDDAAAEAGILCAALAQLGRLGCDLVSLRRVRDDARLAPCLIGAGATPTRSERAPYIDFAASPDAAAFEASLSGKGRADRRRRLRQLAAQGELRRQAESRPEPMRELIGQAMDFKRQWAVNAGQFAPAVFDARFWRCLRDAAARPGPDAMLRVFALRCGDQLAGVEISYAYKRRLFGHVLAPNPAFAKFGAGNALADAAIQDAYAQGYAAYDLLAPADPYKAAWTKASVGVTDYALALNWRGALYARLALGFGRRAASLAPPALARLALRRMAARAQALD